MTNAREHWPSRLGFILAAAGSAIGLGNLWKFPYVAYENNGGGFVLIYLLCVATIGLPIMMAEILIGRRTQQSPVGAMERAVGPRWKVIGGLGVFTGFVILGYYTVVAGWTLHYVILCTRWSFGGYAPGASSPEAFTAFAASGWRQALLAGLFMAATMAVIYKGIGHGINAVSRTLLPALFVILVLLLGSSLTMEGAGQALQFVFVPRLGDLPPSGILDALGQAFFSLSLGMGAMITYGSYLARSESVVRSAVMVVLLDTLIAVCAAVIMFSIIFSVPGLRDSIGASTVGMLFITLPEQFYTVIPAGRILAPLFYVLVAFAALTSTISLMEVIVSYFIDRRGMERNRATTLVGIATGGLAVLCGLSFGASSGLSGFSLAQVLPRGGPLGGIAGTMAAKQGLFAHLDYVAANWFLPVGGFFLAMAAGWFMTRAATEGELVDAGTPRWFRYGVWRAFIRYLAPLAVGCIIALVLMGRDFS